MKLFDLKSPTPQDNEFLSLLNETRFIKEKEILELMWEKYEPFADNQFQIEIRNQFHARYWEMYLGYTLLLLGFNLKKKKYQIGPDLEIDSINGIVIEATTSSGGTGEDSIKMEKLNPGETEWCFVPDNQIILRYRSSIEDKFKKLTKYISNGIIDDNQPFIIAINGRHVPYSILDDEPPNIIKALFPIGNPFVTLDKDFNKIIKQGYHYQPKISKKNQEQISTKIFLDPSYASISGIIFSNSDIFNFPNVIGMDLILIHNPLATNPLNFGWLQIGREYWIENSLLKRKFWKK